MRFTRDGSEAMERLLATTCQEIGAEMQRLVPSSHLQALVLGGGYGRGEGGGRRDADGAWLPLNDYDLVALVAGVPRLRLAHPMKNEYSVTFHAARRVTICLDLPKKSTGPHGPAPGLAADWNQVGSAQVAVGRVAAAAVVRQVDGRYLALFGLAVMAELWLQTHSTSPPVQP